MVKNLNNAEKVSWVFNRFQFRYITGYGSGKSVGTNVGGWVINATQDVWSALKDKNKNYKKTDLFIFFFDSSELLS